MSKVEENKTLKQLLKIEDDYELTQYCCQITGLPIWPLIRIELIQAIMVEWLYDFSLTSSLKRKINYKKIALNAIISKIADIRMKDNRRREILIQSTGLGNYVRNELIFDRLVGYFCNVLPDQTLVYQDQPKEEFWLNYAYGPVLHKTLRNIILRIYSKIVVRDSHKKLSKILIERVANNASDRIGYEFNDDKISNLINLLAERLAALPYISEIYANWFSRRGFKLLLKEDACYGGNSIPIIHAARLNGIVIAEYQHGAVSGGHIAYNVADALVMSDLFKKVLPDYFLSYGSWWSSQINIPVEKISIGNPHLTESMASLEINLSRKDKVLLLGDGIETQSYLDLARKISGFVKSQGLSVVFRPHPFEREKVKSLDLPSDVQLDSHADIYESLTECRIVISELSTGLFEAVGLVEMVLLWETDKSKFAFPDLPFISFAKMEELEFILNNFEYLIKSNKKILSSELWQLDWKNNYMNFVNGVLSQ